MKRSCFLEVGALVLMCCLPQKAEGGALLPGFARIPLSGFSRIPMNVSSTSYDWPLSTPETEGLDARIFEAAVDHARTLGFVDSLLVARNGHLITEEYFNGFDRNTPHKIASASKTFIGALVGIAVGDHLLDPGQKCLDFFPEYVTPAVDPRKHDIELRHLLRMLSGYWDVDLMYSSHRIRYAIEHIPLYGRPGGEWRYSTIGVHLLSGIITRVSGMSTPDFAQLRLFGPLRISVEAWTRERRGDQTRGPLPIAVPLRE